ncbi:hypothetical protein PG987_009762 [Apiospora arundinis]
MRASFVSALVFTALVGSAIANPVEASTKLEKPEEPNPVGYDDSFDDYADYSYQGSILKQALGQISGHIQIVNNYLETIKEPLSPGDKLALVGQIVPPLTSLTGVLDNLPIVGTGNPYLQASALEALEAKGYGRGPKGGDKCNKLCIFDLVGKIVLQCHGVIFSTVSKCGLDHSAQPILAAVGAPRRQVDVGHERPQLARRRVARHDGHVGRGLPADGDEGARLVDLEGPRVVAVAVGELLERQLAVAAGRNLEDGERVLLLAERLVVAVRRVQVLARDAQLRRLLGRLALAVAKSRQGLHQVQRQTVVGVGHVVHADGRGHFVQGVVPQAALGLEELAVAGAVAGQGGGRGARVSSPVDLLILKMRVTSAPRSGTIMNFLLGSIKAECGCGLSWRSGRGPGFAMVHSSFWTGLLLAERGSLYVVMVDGELLWRKTRSTMVSVAVYAGLALRFPSFEGEVISTSPPHVFVVPWGHGAISIVRGEHGDEKEKMTRGNHLLLRSNHETLVIAAAIERPVNAVPQGGRRGLERQLGVGVGSELGQDAGAVPALVKAVDAVGSLVYGQPGRDPAAPVGLPVDFEGSARRVGRGEVERVDGAGEVGGDKLGRQGVGGKPRGENETSGPHGERRTSYVQDWQRRQRR